MSEKKTDCITDEEKQECPLGIEKQVEGIEKQVEGIEKQVEGIKKLFDKTAIMIHDIAFVKVNIEGEEEESVPLGTILNLLLKASSTKIKIIKTEKIWHKSKYVIGFLSFVRKAIIPLLLTGILGVLTRIAISNIKFEEKLNTHEQRIQNIENKK